jgi:Aerobic-type carbon monoxide dehydrogenase, large subunit CoxL/CutL homologs
VEKVAVRLGDSSFPVSSGSGGQWGGNCSTAGVYAACVKLREALAQKIGANPDTTVFADGAIKSGDRAVSLAQLAGESGMVAEDGIEFAGLSETYQQSILARTSSRSAWMPRLARRGSAACWQCAHQDVFLTQRRRAARWLAP